MGTTQITQIILRSIWYKTSHQIWRREIFPILKVQLNVVILLDLCVWITMMMLHAAHSHRQLFLRTGARGRAHRFLAKRPPLSAVFPQSGRLLHGTPVVSHPRIRLPTAVLPTSISTVLAVLLTEPGVVVSAPPRALQLHQLASPATGRVALAAVTVRGERPAVAVPTCTEPRPSAGVPRGPAAAPWTGRGRGGTGGESSRDARRAPRAGRDAGACSGHKWPAMDPLDKCVKRACVKGSNKTPK